MGKSTINGPFSIAMLVYQRVTNKKVQWGNHVRFSGPYFPGESRQIPATSTACINGVAGPAFI
jgi:hypothetical protein